MGTKSKVAKISDVKSGITLYKVYALGKSSFIDKFLCLGKPYQHESGLGLFAPMQGNGYRTVFSLSDCGIIPNCYNGHKTFTTANAANRYFKLVSSGENPHDSDDDFGFHYSESYYTSYDEADFDFED